MDIIWLRADRDLLASDGNAAGLLRSISGVPPVEPHEIRFLPLVKAYPALSRRYGEVSCIAGLDMNAGGWMRLHPVPFRALEDSQKFRKYEPIKARVQRPRDDRRPESWRVDIDSIQVAGPVLSSANGWQARRPIVEPAMAASMCAIRSEQRDGLSLAMFRLREVRDLVWPDPLKSVRPV